MFAVPREKCVRIHASSGTSGKPTIVGYTQADLDLWNTLVARCITVAGGKAGDVLHNAYGYGLFTGGLACMAAQRNSAAWSFRRAAATPSGRCNSSAI